MGYWRDRYIPVFALLAIVYIGLLVVEPYPGHPILKALPILFLAFVSLKELESREGGILALALILSAGGDISLEMDDRFFVVGLMFFTPLDLSFSCWFFYLIGRVQHIVGIGMLGSKSVYFYEQSIGAWIAFGLIPIWMGRKFYIRVLLRIFKRSLISLSF